jgi:hypothetical protein
VVCRRREAMMAPRSPIIEHIPESATIMMAPELGVTTYPWCQLRNPVPMWTEQ